MTSTNSPTTNSLALGGTHYEREQTTDSITLYIPRVKLGHSSRDIRIIFLQQEIGSFVSVDIAYNPHTRYNMAFVTIKKSLNDKINKLKDILDQYYNITLYPDIASKEFWMLFPSKCDHEKEEEELLNILSNSHMSVDGMCKCGRDCFSNMWNKFSTCNV
jgi:hypothetical protein